MLGNSSVNPLTPNSQSNSKQSLKWKKWTLLFFLTLLLHGFLVWLAQNSDWQALQKNSTPIETWDSNKLAQLKQKWEKKQFVLNQRKKVATENSPKNAKYESEFNQSVEKEQRASKTSILPKPDSPADSSQNKKLQNLGIGFKKLISKAQNQPKLNENEGNQYLDDEMLQMGSENLLNTQASKYYSFFKRIYEEIAPLWESQIQSLLYSTRFPAGHFLTLIEYQLDQNGDLIDVQVAQSSGLRSLDAVAVSVFRKLGRFPNPPAGLLQENFQTPRLRFGFMVDTGNQDGFHFKYYSPKY